MSIAFNCVYNLVVFVFISVFFKVSSHPGPCSAILNDENNGEIRHYLRTKVDPGFCEDSNSKEDNNNNNNNDNNNDNNNNNTANFTIKSNSTANFTVDVVQSDEPTTNMTSSKNKNIKQVRVKRLKPLNGKKSSNGDVKYKKTKSESKKSENGKKPKGIISRLKDTISGKKVTGSGNGASGPAVENFGSGQTDEKKKQPLKIKRDINRDEDMLQNILINRLSLNEAGTVPPSLVLVKRKRNEDPILMASRRIRSVVWSKPKRADPVLFDVYY